MTPPTLELVGELFDEVVERHGQHVAAHFVQQAHAHHRLRHRRAKHKHAELVRHQQRPVTKQLGLVAQQQDHEESEVMSSNRPE